MAQRATLRDLLAAGLLKAGEELVCEPRQGEVYKATLHEDGLISHEGTTFDSPSRWASHVGQNARNGWRDVKARGQSLGHFREILLGKSRSGGLTSAPASARRREASPEPSLPPVQEEG
ncbi:MAG: hypothetical protein HY531_02975, partial [Chloroflexi bacterium]|nr:hypothetical protein [Chloroflexota bacterium]